MSLIARVTTWVSGQILTAAALNGEFNNIVNAINSLDAASTPWSNVKTATLTVTGNSSLAGTLAVSSSSALQGLTATTLTTTSTTNLKGTITNDSASAGNIGEYNESVVSGVAIAATGVFKDATSLSLTAGDWDVTLVLFYTVSIAGPTIIYGGISTTSGNSATGLTLGSNYVQIWQDSGGSTLGSQAIIIPAYRVSLSGTTIIYAKSRVDYAATTTTMAARLSARRVR